MWHSLWMLFGLYDVSNYQVCITDKCVNKCRCSKNSSWKPLFIIKMLEYLQAFKWSIWGIDNMIMIFEPLYLRVIEFSILIYSLIELERIKNQTKFSLRSIHSDFLYNWISVIGLYFLLGLSDIIAVVKELTYNILG